MAAKPVTASMAVQCVKMLNLPDVNPSTIRTWAERGHVRKYGLDQFGFMRYDLNDIVRAVSEKAEQSRAVA